MYTISAQVADRKKDLVLQLPSFGVPGPQQEGTRRRPRPGSLYGPHCVSFFLQTLRGPSNICEFGSFPCPSHNCTSFRIFTILAFIYSLVGPFRGIGWSVKQRAKSRELGTATARDRAYRLCSCREQPGLSVPMLSKFHTRLRGQVTSAAMPSILTDDVRPPLL